jgi:hypothetical protein
MKHFDQSKASCGQKYNQIVCEESGTGVLVGDRLSILVGAALRAGEGAEKKKLTCRAA